MDGTFVLMSVRPLRRSAPTLGVALVPLVALVLVVLVGCGAPEERIVADAPSTTTTAPSTTVPVPPTPIAPTTEPAVPAPPITVVVMGSSTAAGIGVTDPAESWVQRFAATLEAADPANEVVNLAAPLLTSFEILPTGWAVPGNRPPANPARNVTRALELKPDVIVVNLPSNDVARGYGPGELLANLDRIAGTAANAGVEVWVTTTQPARLAAPERQRLQNARDAIIGRFGAHAINLWPGLAAPDGTLAPAYDSGDGIHLNAAGHQLVSERVTAAVTRPT